MGQMGEMAVLDTTGHTNIIWDSEKPAEVENARRTFNDLTGKGYKAFRVNRQGAEGERLTTFDANAEKMILVPPIAGG